jgi:hypothetical protein
MSVGLLEREALGMAAKRKGRPKTSERTDTTVKIDRAIIVKAKMVAAGENRSMADLLSEILRPLIDERFARLAQRMTGESRRG